MRRRRITSMKALMSASRKKIGVGVTCWELKSHLFKALVLPTFTYGIQIWGCDLKNSQWKVFKKGMKIHVMSHVKVHSLKTYCIKLAKFRELPLEVYYLKLIMDFHHQLAHLPSSWLVNQATSLSQHLAEQGYDTWHKINNHVTYIMGLSHWEAHDKASKNTFDAIKEAFLAKEWNSSHLLG